MRTLNQRPRFSNKPRVSFWKGKSLWLILFIFLLMTFSIIKFAEPKFFPIRNIEVLSENEEINTAQAKKIAEKKIKGFFLTDMMDIKKQLLSLSDVDTINIRRVWPDTLVINITAQKLVAKWGNHCAVNSKGEVVTKNLFDENVPLFNGPQDQSFCMLQQYQTMSNHLKNVGLRITKLDLNDRRSWQLVLDNGIHIMLGRKDVENRLLRFVNIWPKLNKMHNGQIAVVDLRYSNGVAIRPSTNSKENNDDNK